MATWLFWMDNVRLQNRDVWLPNRDVMYVPAPYIFMHISVGLMIYTYVGITVRREEVQLKRADPPNK